MTRQADRRYTRELEEYWKHERWFDACVAMHLNREAGAQLTPDEQAMAWVGEALVQAVDRRETKNS
jgi:hypothetical protein